MNAAKIPVRLATGALAIALAGLVFPGAPSATPSAPPGALPGAEVTVVRVEAATDDDRRRLLGLGLDVVEADDATAELFLYSGAEADALRAAGFDPVIVDHDRSPAARALAATRAAEERAEATAATSELPTGRVSYRTLDEIEAELAELEAAYPDLVRLFELPHPTLLGRTVHGVEISRDVHAPSGEPVFLTTGVHHAREWPTAEVTLEFTWDVLQHDGADERITRLLDSTTMIVVPVVNPDGYELSRSLVNEQKRKNCRVAHGAIPTYEQCADPVNANRGVDLNRNYAPFWAGPGSSASQTASNHYGEAPYSEPEIHNIAELTAAHQVTVAVHNHSPDGRLLRAPSSPLEPVPADVELYDALAQELGAALDWPAGPWPEIYYEASGVAEQNAYYTAGIFGFTTEMTPGHDGLARFHPPYEYVVDQYFGTGSYPGSSMREALLIAWDAAADPALHSVLTGRAKPGVELTLSKDVVVDSSPLTLPGGGTGVVSTPVTLSSTLTVPAGGRFEWHVQPSPRPSQYASAHLPESWTVSCRNRSGRVVHSQQVTVERGQSAVLDLRRCPAVPPRDR
ncbi:M14 family zinc carboxypeptidase [Jiangella anatolica]|uniref:Peptidase M14 n=1 Tax=Jiangella anatolica TaxID=2670374 RepID=A0A2W2CXN7_9ACTN|nr:M14 family zinc carboxypeptidase [Jiangella anatolica]PZF84983.1 peptidase M14 [Jiangella anatolica]